MEGCPVCGSECATALGILGSLIWLRCRDCGCDFNVSADSELAVEIAEVIS